MENLKTQILFCGIFLTVLVLRPFLATSREVEDQSEFDYVIGSPKGPDRWGYIHPEWSMCKNGTKQSPIDVLNRGVDVVSRLGLLRTSYKPSNAILKNRVHDIMLKWTGDAGFIEINGTQYAILQCHWHSPSEHAVDGRRFDLEAHLVHESADGDTAVVGFFYSFGQLPDPFLFRIQNYLRIIGQTQQNTVVGLVNPRDINVASGTEYYRYNGSLTTPPCTQNVSWTVFRQVKTVTREQVRLLRASVHDNSSSNARPLQPLNMRTVKLFRPSLNPGP